MPKTIVIVGAGAGVGLAIAERFGREGFKVGLIARNTSRLEEMADKLKELGIEAAAFTADVRDKSALAGAIEAAVDRFGGIDVLEYSPTATGDTLLTPREMTEENEQFHLELAVLGAITAVRNALPSLQKSDNAAILFTTAASAQYPVTFTASFGVAAGALLNYARVLNQEFAGNGIYAGIVSIAGLVVQRGEEGGRSPKGLELIAAQDIADLHWELYTRRDRVEAIIGDTGMLRQLTGL
jgi:NADP-dependent 3-hydroxy acid dehydrogenase YdfG